MFNSKISLKVEMNDLDCEKESLAYFLQKHFELKSSLNQNGLELNGADVSTFKLLKMVNKFLNSKKLNSTHWANVQGNAVKINRFNRKKKEKKSKHPVTASTIKHGW